MSNSRHDFQQCKCESCFIDGGNDPYIRIGGDPCYIEIEENGIWTKMTNQLEKKEDHQITIDEYLEELNNKKEENK